MSRYRPKTAVDLTLGLTAYCIGTLGVLLCGIEAAMYLVDTFSIWRLF